MHNGQGHCGDVTAVFVINKPMCVQQRQRYIHNVRASRASSIDRRHRRNAIALDSVPFFLFFFFTRRPSTTQQITAEKNRTIYTSRKRSRQLPQYIQYTCVSFHLFCLFTSRAGTSCECSLDYIFQQLCSLFNARHTRRNAYAPS